MSVMQCVECHECNDVIGVLAFGWEVPKFIICNHCRLKELEGDE